jgi:hypothetical protein
VRRLRFALQEQAGALKKARDQIISARVASGSVPEATRSLGAEPGIGRRRRPHLGLAAEPVHRPLCGQRPLHGLHHAVGQRRQPLVDVGGDAAIERLDACCGAELGSAALTSEGTALRNEYERRTMRCVRARLCCLSNATRTTPLSSTHQK